MFGGCAGIKKSGNSKEPRARDADMTETVERLIKSDKWVS
jgi:hypothetical protein